MDIFYLLGDRITILSNDYGEVSFLYSTEKLDKANQLRREILSKPKSYAIDQVLIRKNTTNIIDENLALIFGLLVINNQKLISQHPQLRDFTDDLYVDFSYLKGAREETLKGVREETLKGHLLLTDDIPGVPFFDTFSLLEIKKNQELACTLKITANNSKIHAKWSPVSSVTFHKVEKGYQFYLELIGSLDLDTIFHQLGCKKITQVDLIKTSDETIQSESILIKENIPKNMHHTWLHNYL